MQLLEDKYDQFLKKINVAKTILLLRHIHPDGDCVGAQQALYHFIKLNFPNKVIHFWGEKISHYLTELFPNEYKKKPKKLLTNYDTQILVDTSSKSRVDYSLKLSKNLIIIDHHPKEDIKSDFEIRCENLSSACEILTKMFFYFQKKYGLKLNKEIAKCLYVGITTDTKRMWYNLTSDLLRITADLLEFGIDTKFINETIYYWEINEIRFRNILINKAKIVGCCIYVIIEAPTYAKYNLNYQTAKDLTLSLVEINKGKYFVIAVMNNETNEYHVSLRSKEKRIDQFAIKFGGGGHPLASGVKIKEKKKVQKLIKEIIEYSK